jgi:hypothetical protein
MDRLATDPIAVGHLGDLLVRVLRDVSLRTQGRPAAADIPRLVVSG